MKVTIVQGAFLPVPPIMGGAVEKRWFKLSDELQLMGHGITYISRRHPELPNTETIGNVAHIRVPGFDAPYSFLKRLFFDFIYSLRAIRKIPDDSDIIVTNAFWLPILLGNKQKRKNMVDVARMPKGQIWLYRKSARLRANSRPVEKAIHADDPKSVGRTIMIPNPLPFTPPQHHQWDRKENSILYCGRIHPEKGIDLLLEAIDDLPPGWRVDIVGPWELRQGGGGPEYLNKLLKQAAGKCVKFHGPIFDVERLSEFYGRARFFCYPSIAEKGETFGLAPLEAMAYGCVPIVSSLECFQDFIENGRNGVIFDHRRKDAARCLKEQIQILLNDSGATYRMACEATSVCRSHSPTAIATLFSKDFERIIQGNNS